MVEEGGILVWGQQVTQGLHQSNSYFTMLPQPFTRSLWSLQGSPITVLPFPNPPYFHVFFIGLFFIPLCPIAWAKAELMGTLADPTSGRRMGRKR